MEMEEINILSKLLRGRLLLSIMVALLLSVTIPATVWADSDIKITVTDPNRGGGVFNEGTTVNTVFSSPKVSNGENRVLGTLRISGKKGIAVPLQQGNRVMVSLPLGVCYMQTPNTDNFRNYVKWPEVLDGVNNQIRDTSKKLGVKFISGTPRSITVEVNNIDTSGRIMALDFVFDKENYSSVRVSRFIDVSQEYMKEPMGKVTRLEFFKLLADVTLPFDSCPLIVKEDDKLITDRFSDAAKLTSKEANKIKPLVDSGIISGYQDGLLKPYDYITRVQAANLLGKIFPREEKKADFKDTIPDWAVGMNAAVSHGIAEAYPDGTFKFDEFITKLDVLNMLQKTLEAYSH